MSNAKRHSVGPGAHTAPRFPHPKRRVRHKQANKTLAMYRRVIRRTAGRHDTIMRLAIWANKPTTEPRVFVRVSRD